MRWSILAAVLILIANIHESRSQDLYFGGFDGTWEGTIRARNIDLNSFESEGEVAEARYKFVVTGANVHVFAFIKSKNEWSELKPNIFQIVTNKTNAVIYAINSSQDVMDRTGSGGWVETHVYTVTHKDADHLYVYRTRAVNNYLISSDKDDARVLAAGGGELSRVK
jgi:hypothetical protein